MPSTGGLQLELIAEAQAAKWQTHNDALDQIDRALTEAWEVDVAAGDGEVPEPEARRNQLVRITGAAAAGRAVALPAVRRMLICALDGAAAHPVAVRRGTTAVLVQPGQALFVFADGTPNGLVALGAGVLTAGAGYALPAATAGARGGVRVGAGLLVSEGDKLAVDPAAFATAAALNTGLGAADARLDALEAASGGAGGGGGGGAVASPLDLPAAAGTRARLRATGADADVGLVLSPKGAGGLRAQDHDGAATGGDARGARSVDWQQERAAAAEVASGNHAAIGGGRHNRATGEYACVPGGNGSAATGVAAFAAGSGNTASGSYSVALGVGGVASGSHSGTLAGLQNEAAATNATVGGGQQNAAAAWGATVAGGAYNTADGDGSWSPGGMRASARGVRYKGVWAGGYFNLTRGDGQNGELPLMGVTTGGTPVALTSDGGAPDGGNQLAVPPTGAFGCSLLVVAQDRTGATRAMWRFDVLAERGADGAPGVSVASDPPAGVATAPRLSAGGGGAFPGTVKLLADPANNCLAVEATGAAGKTVRWMARVMSAEIGQS